MKYLITEEMYKKCQKFAEDSVGTSIDKYARRNQFDVEKITKDIRNGKIGEEGTYQVLLDKLPNLVSPDYNIYDKKNKSWASDMHEPSGIKIAVKSQDIDSAIAYGDSWVFQIGNGKYDCDTAVFKEIDPNYYVVFNSLNVPKRHGTIRAIVKIQWLHDNKLFKEMKIHQLRNNKVAVYLSDLEKYSDQLWQI
jgi:hypothetical protein